MDHNAHRKSRRYRRRIARRVVSEIRRGIEVWFEFQWQSPKANRVSLQAAGCPQPGVLSGGEAVQGGESNVSVL